MATRRMSHRRVGAVLITTGGLLALAVSPAFAFTSGGSSAESVRTTLLDAEQAGADANELDDLDTLEQGDDNAQGDEDTQDKATTGDGADAADQGDAADAPDS